MSRGKVVNRFVAFYDQKIKENQLENFKAYQTSKKQIKLLKNEEKKVKKVKV